MASGKKGAKGNKTAHVLNLLTAPGEAPPASAGESAGDAPATETAQPAGRPLLPPILEVAKATDNQLAPPPPLPWLWQTRKMRTL